MDAPSRACFLAVAAGLALACGPTPPKPTQRLCAPGETTAAWVDAQLASHGAQGFLDGLRLGHPTIFCAPDGTEVHGELVFVGLERIALEGDVVLRRRPWLQIGAIPKVDPRFEMWHVEPTAGAEPLRVTFGAREPL